MTTHDLHTNRWKICKSTQSAKNKKVAVAIYNLADEAVIVRGIGHIVEDEKEFFKRTQQHIDKYEITLDEHGRDKMGIPLSNPKIRCVIEVAQEKFLFW